jgi:large subunit ribosomal protein L22
MIANSQEIVSSTSKYIRISPTKLSPILSKIRGKSYKDALQILKGLPQKAGVFVWQTLYSAASNASYTSNIDKDSLVVIEAYANQGPMLKRMQPRAKGRAFQIQKKLSHLTIRLTKAKNIN